MLNPRYEVKMQCSQTRLPEIRGLVRLNKAAFDVAYPPRQVNNIYFDTYGLDTFNDHIEGVAERRKLRFRWYGTGLDQVRGQLELKEKDARVGWKQVCVLGQQVDLRATDWQTFQRGLLDGLPTDDAGARFREALQVSRPLVATIYQREYYVSADGALRLTLDYDQRAFDQWLTARLNFDFPAPLVDDLVIEFKCAVEHTRRLADALADFPLRANRHSKFVNSLGALLER